MTKKNRSSPSTRGFTLLEVLIAVLILGIIATVALPMLSSYTEKAREAREEANVVVKAQAIDRYVADHKVGLGMVYDASDDTVTTYGLETMQGPTAQLLLPTDVNGNVMGDPVTADPAPFDRGPYLADLPPEPASMLLGMRKELGQVGSLLGEAMIVAPENFNGPRRRVWLGGYKPRPPGSGVHLAYGAPPADVGLASLDIPGIIAGTEGDLGAVSGVLRTIATKLKGRGLKKVGEKLYMAAGDLDAKDEVVADIAKKSKLRASAARAQELRDLSVDPSGANEFASWYTAGKKVNDQRALITSQPSRPGATELGIVLVPFMRVQCAKCHVADAAEADGVLVNAWRSLGIGGTASELKTRTEEQMNAWDPSLLPAIGTYVGAARKNHLTMDYGKGPKDQVAGIIEGLGSSPAAMLQYLVALDAKIDHGGTVDGKKVLAEVNETIGSTYGKDHSGFTDFGPVIADADAAIQGGKKRAQVLEGEIGRTQVAMLFLIPLQIGKDKVPFDVWNNYRIGRENEFEMHGKRPWGIMYFRPYQLIKHLASPSS